MPAYAGMTAGVAYRACRVAQLSSRQSLNQPLPSRTRR